MPKKARDRSVEAVAILMQFTKMNEVAAKAFFDLCVDQAVEEARNERKGLAGDNRRRSSQEG